MWIDWCANEDEYRIVLTRNGTVLERHYCLNWRGYDFGQMDSQAFQDALVLADKRGLPLSAVRYDPSILTKDLRPVFEQA